MKRIVYFVLISLFLSTLNVNAAACKSSEIAQAQKDASNIKINYEAVEETKSAYVYDQDTKTITNEKYDYIVRTMNINLYNVTKNIYIVQTEKKYYTDGVSNIPLDENKDPVEYKDEYINKKVINYSDTNNGKYTFNTKNILEYTDYKFEIYSNFSNCDNTLVRTINYRKPRFNEYSENLICQNNVDIPLCQKYIIKDIELNGKDFETEVQKYLKSNSNNSSTNPEKTSKSNKSIIIYSAIGTLLVGGLVTYLFVSKKRRTI